MAKNTSQTEVQEKILHSANKLFSEKGFDNVRMQNIADASGIPIEEITKYYPLNTTWGLREGGMIFYRSL